MPYREFGTLKKAKAFKKKISKTHHVHPKIVKVYNVLVGTKKKKR